VNHPRADLTAFLDGALPEARAAEVREHLSSCPACREEEARLRGAVAVLASLPPAPEPSPFLATRLEARLREERERAPAGLLAQLSGALAAALGRRRLLALAGGLAGLLAAVGVPLRSWLDTRAMVKDLDLLQDYETASALDVDSPEDAELVAHLDQLERGQGGGRP
jgi:anti-sigma factor RsiW